MLGRNQGKSSDEEEEEKGEGMGNKIRDYFRLRGSFGGTGQCFRTAQWL